MVQPSTPSTKKGANVALIAGVAALAVAVGLIVLRTPGGGGEAGLPAGCVLGGSDIAVGGPISLVDQDGKAVTEKDFSEAPTLIYFGFSYCPDICPMALQTAKKVLSELEPGSVQPVLISLDPERDTPAALQSYVEADVFPEGLVGLTGSGEAVGAAAKAFRVGWQKARDAKSAAGYTIDHTSYFYLMDENWRLAALYPSTLPPDEAAQCVKAGLKRAG